MFYTYVLLSERDHKYYIGFTMNLRDRIKKHNEGKVKSTVGRQPFQLKAVVGNP
ncbi:MAG: GIY-YIG nuclease family protein [Deltaproteobacteria bacterium]|nr:GIY-YIG nuclease family protein [Deltaproteobacteria bacterium]